MCTVVKWHTQGRSRSPLLLYLHSSPENNGGAIFPQRSINWTIDIAHGKPFVAWPWPGAPLAFTVRLKEPHSITIPVVFDRMRNTHLWRLLNKRRCLSHCHISRCRFEKMKLFAADSNCSLQICEGFVGGNGKNVACTFLACPLWEHKASDSVPINESFASGVFLVRYKSASLFRTTIS